jgi:autotransporter-associated beta strand protein
MPVQIHRRFYLWQLIVAVLLPILLTSPALAEDYTWTGVGDGTTWTDPTNWNPNTAAPGVGPSVGDTVRFNAAVNIALGGNPTVDALTLNAASAQFTGGNLNATNLSLTAANPMITMPAGGQTLTINGALATGGNDFTFQGNGSLYIQGNNNITGGGNINLGNGGGLYMSGNQTLDLPGGASGAGTSIVLVTGATLTIDTSGAAVQYQGDIQGAGNLTKNGAASLTLSGSSTYNGNTIVNAGELAATGAGDQLPTTTRLILNAPGNCRLDGQTVASLEGNGTLNVDGAGMVIVNQAITRTFTGNVTGAAGTTLRKSGAGTMTITGNISPALEVVGGTLVLNGTGFASVSANGGDLMGTGTATQLMTIQNGALRPGNSIGTFNATGGFDQLGGGTLAIEVSGGAADQVNVTGAVSLNGNITVTGTPTIGAVLTIIANDGADAVTGTFTGLAEGATVNSGGQQYEISYAGGTGNDVTLTAFTGNPPGGGGGGGGGNTPDPEPDPTGPPAPQVSQGSGPNPIGSLDGSTLTWPQVEGADHYRIYRADCPGCKREAIGWVADTSFVDASVLPGKPYYYWVRSENSDGMGPYSNWLVAWRYEQNPGWAGDFNGDGIADLLWWDPSTNQLSIWFMNNGQVANVSATGEALDINEWLLIATADLNGDGACDLLWWKPETGETIAWYLDKAKAAAGGDGDWLIKTSVALDTVSGFAAMALTGDLNGDGKADILWRDYSSGQVTLWIMGDDGAPLLNGPPTPAGESITRGDRPGISGTLNWQVAGLGDADGNGKSDVIWKDARNNRLATWIMDASNISAVTQDNKSQDSGLAFGWGWRSQRRSAKPT